MSESLKILVVAGHPADIFDHCGGTLLNHIRRGDSVICVSLTQGLRIHDEVISDIFREKIDQFSKKEVDALLQERQKVKYAEVLEACALFGINDVRFLDYDDEILTVNTEMISSLASLIREVHPDIVITHWPYQQDAIGNHHAVTGQLTLASITAAAGVNFNDRHPACRVGQVVYMLCPCDCAAVTLSSQGKSAFATYYVDVTNCVDLKIKAINTMKSQKYNLRGYSKKTTEQWNGSFGARVRLPYAEGFCFELPEVGTYLPLSEHRKWLARADEHDLLRHASGMQGLDVEIEEVD
ncbi:MAG: PIG-L deacetylase family protein [Christensenellales bacterium]|jgi:LmbE family N-acetylglucosaminyl deacetylase